MNKKKIRNISAIVAIGVVLVVGTIVGVTAYIRHKNMAETGNLLGVEWYNETDPQFTITTVEELYELAELSDFYNFKGQTIKLGADLVINEGNAEDWVKDAPAKKWNPITGFAGIFDGQGHTISGLYGRGFERRMALFTDTDRSCMIKNLSLVNSYFETTGHRGTASFVSGGGGKFSKLYSDAVFNHKGENVGGIASSVDVQSTFEECWYDGSISLDGRDCGGIVDEALGARVTIKHCLFSGAIYSNHTLGGTRTGGIIGRGDKAATMIISDTLSSGVIQCEKKIYTGALIGSSYAGVQWTISDTYVSSDTYSSVIGQSGNKGTFTGSALSMRTSELTGVKAYQWTTLNFDTYWAVVEDGTPILKRFAKQVPSLEGVKKAYDTSWYTQGAFDFTITTREQLYGLYIISASTNFQDCKVKLGADIVVNEGDASKWAKEEPALPWFPIQKFAGQFDGQGHTISGLYCKSGNDYLGLFSQLTAPSVVQNVSLKNSYFEKTGTSAAFMGSIAGETYGIIQNVYSDAIIVSEGNQVGGIVGRLNDVANTNSNRAVDGEDYAVLNNCWFDGSISMLAWEEENSGACEAGGMVGRVVQGDAIIEHCLNSGTLSSEVTGRAVTVGGIVGYVVNPGQLIIDDCLNTGEIKTDYTICVGSIVARMGNDERVVTITDTYATKESYPVTVSTNARKGILNGDAIRIDKSWLTGYKGYQYTTLDFDKYWSVVVSPDGTPILSQFAEKNPSVKGFAKMMDTSWYKNDAKEMTIDSLADLYGFAMLSGTTNFKDQMIKLAADIVVNSVDASILVSWANETATPENGWLTIGSYEKQFAGTFDGQGHSISGVYSVSEEQYNGLFGVTTPTSMIKNLSLKDSYFAFTGENKTEEGVEAYAYIGSIAGDLRGDLDSVYSNAIVKSAANVAGGLVGRANAPKVDGIYTTSIINNCWFDGQVVLIGETARYAGGIAGVAVQGNVEFKHCLNSGSVSNERPDGGQFLGGIVGTDWATNTVVNIEDCLNTGAITAKYVNCIGSIVGRIQKDGSVFTITNTAATKESCTKTTGVASSVWSTSGKATLKGGAITILEDMLEGYGGYQYTMLDFDNYWALVLNPDATPVLKTFASATPSIGERESIRDWYSVDAKTMEINSVVDLYGVSILSETTNFAGQTLKLTESLKLDPSKDWLPIGSSSKPFAGTFDGGMNTISGMYLDSTNQYIGMFAVTSPTSMIKNFYLQDSTFIYSGDSLKYNEEKQKNEEYGAFIGSVAGDLRGDLDSVYSNAVVKSVAMQAGGLVGRANGQKDSSGKYTTSTISNCWFDGQVLLTGDIARYAGGVAGVAVQGNIEITHCLNTGSVSNERPDGGEFLGGFLGTDWGKCTITISDSVSAGTVTANNINCIGSIIGRLQKEGTKVSVTDTYAVEGKCVDITGADRTIWSEEEGVVLTNETEIIKEAQLKGMSAYLWTGLDFETYWSYRANDITIPTRFVKNAQNVGFVGDTKWYEEAGENATDYHIESEEEFYGFMKLVNDGVSFEDATIHLDVPLRLNVLEEGNEEEVVCQWQDGVVPMNEWRPIGTTDNPFAGTFDGHGNTIQGVYVNANVAGSGLFGVTATGSELKNIKLQHSYITNTATNTGSVAGCLGGNIDNIYSNAVVETTAAKTGGIIGQVDTDCASITRCWFDGNVESTKDYCGGVVGHLYHGTVDVNNCLNTGDIKNTFVHATDGVEESYPGVAGLIGYVRGDADASTYPALTIKNCINTGSIEAVGKHSVGSVIGRTLRAQLTTIENVYTTDDCVNIAKAEGKSKDEIVFGTEHRIDGIGSFSMNNCLIEGLPVIVKEDDLKDKLAYQNTDLSFYSSEDADGIWAAISGKTPEIQSLSTATAISNLSGEQRNSRDWYYNAIVWTKSVTNGDTVPKNTTTTYTIMDEKDFYGFAKLVNNKVVFDDSTVKLDRSIDLNPGWAPELNDDGELKQAADNKWTPIGTAASEKRFAGIFDGQGNTIEGIYTVNNGKYTGLFGSLHQDAVVKNFLLKDSYFYGKDNTTDNRAYVGSVAGESYGTIDSVYSEAIVATENKRAGGIVGTTNGNASSNAMITNTWFNGILKATADKTGGIVGSHQQYKLTINNCLVTGDLTELKDSKHTGAIIGHIGYVGGANLDVTMTNNLVALDEAITGSNTGSVVGYINYRNVGKSGTCTFVNTFVTTESGGVHHAYVENREGADKVTVTIIGDAEFKEASAFYGTAGYKLLGEGWVAVRNGVSVPEPFADLVVTENIADVQTFNTDWYYTSTGADVNHAYEIAEPSDLYGLAELVNAGITFSSKYVELTADIDLNEGWTATINEDTGALSVAEPINEWTPIGATISKYFRGNFDGNGNTIRGVYIDSENTYVGLFGYLGGTISNLQIANSYFKSYAGAQSGSLAGTFAGTKANNVYSDAYIIGTANENTAIELGGIIGRLNGSGNHNVDTCWFEGSVIQTATVCKASATGGIVGKSNAGINSITNCLNSGKVYNYFDKTKSTGDESKNNLIYLGGILGWHTSADGAVTIDKCLNLGEVEAKNHKFSGTTSERGAGPIVGVFAKAINVTNTLWLNVAHFDDKTQDNLWYGYNNKGTIENTTGSTQYADETALISAVSQGESKAMVLGFDASGEWTILKVQENNQVKEMAPILKDFKAWWLDENSYTKNILMIGNSFCYYYVEELYGIANEMGIHLNIYNVYSSGCPLSKHWTWLQEDAKNYEFYLTDANGRRAISGNVGLKECLAAEDWDVISLQNGSTGPFTEYEALYNHTEPYVKDMYAYLRTQFPNAEYYWHDTWVYEVGYTDDSNPAKNVTDRENQLLRYDIHNRLSDYISNAYNVKLVPTGDAWNTAREDVLFGTTLCGRIKTGDLVHGDYYHDGDVGGGQYLNACVWFETLTGQSCIGNTWRPDYELSEEKIQALQQHAHDAVQAMSTQ